MKYGPGSSIGIVTDYGLDGPVRFSTHPDRPWGPPSLLYDGYWVFPGAKYGRGLLLSWTRKTAAKKQPHNYISSHANKARTRTTIKRSDSIHVTGEPVYSTRSWQCNTQFLKKTMVKTTYVQPRTSTQEYIHYTLDAGLDRSTHDKDHAHHYARTYDY